MAVEVAKEFKISTTTFSSLIEHESRFDPLIKDSPQGDRGILQINRKWHAEVSDACAYDPECAMRWAAQYIADNGYDEWTVCNCYAFAQVKVGKRLPPSKDIRPNSTPIVGSIAILNFNGVIHYQVVTGLDEDGYSYIGANREGCVIAKGHDQWGDPRLVGFFDPHAVDSRTQSKGP